MKRSLILPLIIVCICALLAAGCTTQSPGAAVPPASEKSQGDTLMQQAEQEFSAANYRAAEDLFIRAQENYTAEGNPAAALRARDRSTKVMMILYPFPWNRSVAEAQVASAFPDLSLQEQTAQLDSMKPTALMTDGEIMYSSETINNIQFHNIPLIRKRMAAKNHTPIYDEMVPLLLHRTGTGSKGEPVVWEGTESIAIPRSKLPATGTFRLWLPLPIEYVHQTNVTILSLEPAQYMKSTTGTSGDIGIVYFEFPLEEMKDPFINATAKFRFTRHEVRFTIDPAKVLPYNTSSPEYQKYTKSGVNIVITPAMKKKAQEIVGNETNPYNQTRKIYWYIVDTYPYSHAPHSYLDAIRKPESEYMLETGEGDCGTQSMYFAALCRALGIPARAAGGYQMFEANPGTHFWAEYYLEGYGWVPNDVTAAEGGDWSYNATPDDRHRWKEYFAQNLDPYRYVIQKDVDIPLVPAITRPVTNDMAFQEPRAECDTCTEDPIFWIAEDMTISMERV
ncbi:MULTISPECIES: transglutaminase-like domain-containing protein [unclassified Methanoregula]|uniref:transglutaminase-like domain-containing protein n=1 Tax=unclassified Methanoregula TaxID=2649730 RepID=UPI0009D06C81|nr:MULTISPECIES: transglutaminase-like domain-containing protein [unclassified Methanoregula]OPX65306.1 MAG: Transglutaminase-like superfamily protein [Methanoregula sp. PtaB.Bin085]OPY32215.1 MAG: Transglutaminase-like superfamily protein [Methanoregula sp. PtaU1.Bin006]